ncbi:LOW QUALITY PROTEIN: uncharacterized protein WCC33_002970 [Rhinophrynus dorsalis]
MEGLQPPPKLQLTGNVAENWRRFKQRFELYPSAIDADRKMKASLFLHVMGKEALEVYNNFVFSEGDNLKLKPVIDTFEEYCITKRNVTYERHKFFTCMQKPGESIDQYVTELRNCSKTCEFGELTNSLIKDRTVCGIPDNGLKERLLREQDLDLEKALVLCRAAETVKSQAKKITNETCVVDQLRKCEQKRNMVKKQMQSAKGKILDLNKRQTPCNRCLTEHSPKKCPAYGQSCNKCGKLNHYARCCKSTENQSKVHMLIESAVEEFYSHCRCKTLKCHLS